MQGRAGKVIGLRRFEIGLRGFGRRADEGVHREGGRGEGTSYPIAFGVAYHASKHDAHHVTEPVCSV